MQGDKVGRGSSRSDNVKAAASTYSASRASRRVCLLCLWERKREISFNKYIVVQVLSTTLTREETGSKW